MNASLATRNLAHRRLVVRWTATCQRQNRSNAWGRTPEMRQLARMFARRVFMFEAVGSTWQSSYLSGRARTTEVQA